ncbi:MAG: PIN domain-containing protein [Rhizobacter sp.]|nr:PIN domain-containing protein [Rhizobacter sp.]
MAVVFDASVLIDLFNKKLSGDRRSRLDHLVASLAKQRTKVLIPSPALAEFLVKAGKAKEGYLNEIRRHGSFVIEPFDQRAAIECALLLAEAWARSQKGKVTHTKFKFDWQIVAIAASRNATAIYSDDPDISRAASRVNISVHRTDDLPIPSSALQRAIPFDEPDT